MNEMSNTNTENNERGLLPYPIIIAANKGEPEAMKIVVQHYGSYMTSLSMRKLRDEHGNTYWAQMKMYLTAYGQSLCSLFWLSRFE
ncbi:helix-turn-helix domain-containing protein [Amphibacillus sediminis]|uniref:helix-turn-helix domain-containing protein n=1 Tax=Amphibacillus sediminis TaxID=360185 RepID=UPI000AB930AD